MGSPVQYSASGTRRALALGPLLAAIDREVRERSAALALLLVRRQEHPVGSSARRLLDAECATHRSELRHVHVELGRLGCQIVSQHPRVFLVAGPEGADSVLFWGSE
jgi:hypothetical protein